VAATTVVRIKMFERIDMAATPQLFPAICLNDPERPWI
jgi:hypothetical protein